MRTYKVVLTGKTSTFTVQVSVFGGLDQVYEEVASEYPSCRILGPSAITRIA